MRGRSVPQGWKRPYLEQVGPRLRELREAAGLSRPELAAQVGMTRSSIRKLEAGDHAPRPETVARLAAVLGVIPDTLTDPASDPDQRLASGMAVSALGADSAL
jgi:transcriptional regulator with XRE-family HTH domain